MCLMEKCLESGKAFDDAGVVPVETQNGWVDRLEMVEGAIMEKEAENRHEASTLSSKGGNGSAWNGAIALR